MKIAKITENGDSSNMIFHCFESVEHRFRQVSQVALGRPLQDRGPVGLVVPRSVRNLVEVANKSTPFADPSRIDFGSPGTGTKPGPRPGSGQAGSDQMMKYGFGTINNYV